LSDPTTCHVDAGDIEGRPEADHHLLLASCLAKFHGKRLVDASLAGVRVDRIPHGFSGLIGLRQHVPVVPGPLHHLAGRVVQHHVVFAGSPMPAQHGALAAMLKVSPRRKLVVARAPVIRQGQ
jgi:hypothetical protein